MLPGYGKVLASLKQENVIVHRLSSPRIKEVGLAGRFVSGSVLGPPVGPVRRELPPWATNTVRMWYWL